MNSLPVIESLVRDLRYAARMLRKTPGFTIVALVTLAVGIGVNTAVFSVVDSLLLRPLPYPTPERLGTVITIVRSPRGQAQEESVDGRTWFAIHDSAKTIDASVSSGFGDGVNLVANGQAASVRQQRVSAGYFHVLGVPALVGREFNADEDRAGGPAVVVLSYPLWTRLFAGNPTAIGQAITLRGEPFTVVGVMPAGFTSQAPVDAWTPLRPSTTGEGGGTNYLMIARLRPQTTWAEANAELAQIGSTRSGRAADVSSVCTLIPLQQGYTSEIRQPLLMLWGAVGMVLLIACVNIAGLLLARAGMRTREIATRMALGSGRRAVIRQLLVESALLSLLGGALGVGLGWAVLGALKRLGTDVFTLAQPIDLDARVLVATLFIALATSVVFGLVPALHASRVDVQATLAESGTRSVAGGTGRRSRAVLVVVEVAMGVVLLVSAGLLVRTFVHLRSLDPGFDPANVITATASLQDARYKDTAKVDLLFRETLARMRQIPGVEGAGVSLQLPYQRLLNLGFKPLDGGSTLAGNDNAITNFSYVTPGFIAALRIPVRRGRDFTDADQAGSSGVAIVNEAFAARYYKGSEMMGRRIRIAGREREVIGVVGNARATSAGWGNFGPIGAPPIVYIPVAQTNGDFLKLVHTWFSPSWVIRSSGPVEGVIAGVQRAIESVDPLLPIAKVRSMSDVRDASLSQQRFMMTLVLGLGAAALLLAAIGIHGLIANSVAERRRELGIRLALGATSGQVLRAVVMPGVALAAVGVVVGSLGALAVVRLLQSFLWGVTPTDPPTFVAVIVTLLVVAALASLIPGLRVLRLDPAQTLRAE